LSASFTSLMVLLPLQEHPPDLPGSRVHLLATDVELELCKKKNTSWCEREYV